MKKGYFILPLLILALQLLCHAEETKLNIEADKGESKWSANNINLAQTDPISFLSLLKERKSGYVTVYPAPKDWIKMEHIEQLMKLIDSKEPAASVLSIVSSRLPSNEPSTIGNEAMFLIEGFRKGRYPPGLCSVFGSKSDPEEYREWYNKQKK